MRCIFRCAEDCVQHINIGTCIPSHFYIRVFGLKKKKILLLVYNSRCLGKVRFSYSCWQMINVPPLANVHNTYIIQYWGASLHIHLGKLQNELFSVSLRIEEPTSVFFSCDQTRKWLLSAARKNYRGRRKRRIKLRAQLLWMTLAWMLPPERNDIFTIKEEEDHWKLSSVEQFLLEGFLSNHLPSVFKMGLPFPNVFPWALFPAGRVK